MSIGDEDILERRRRLLGPNVSTFYRQPVHIVRGEGAWLFDADGKRYLDGYNNVPHVGHAHPRVVEAIAKQAGTLATHTRYLHEGVLDYIERLAGRLGHGLSQMVIVCTGSEANDVAMRMARAATGKCGFIATDATYHGNTALVSQLTAGREPVGGRNPNIRFIPAPDALLARGVPPDEVGAALARELVKAKDELEEEGFGFAALVIDAFFANEGFPDLPPRALDGLQETVRRTGGTIIADEVQPGFGRLGSHFWGFEHAGLRPDIVTMGKPMGNGYPVAAVATRPEIMSAFREGFGYFNTFGGNPVAAAAASAVLDVIEDEGLMENAQHVGARLRQGLESLSHPRLGAVRGAGLFAGVEVLDLAGPVGGGADALVEGLRARGILAGTAGRHDHVLKIRPPLCFSTEQADRLVAALADTLNELPA